MVPAGTLGAVRKHLAKTANRLTFPRAYLVRMHLYVAVISCIVLSPRHASSATLTLKSAVNLRRLLISVFLRYPVEYTLKRLLDLPGPAQTCLRGNHPINLICSSTPQLTPAALITQKHKLNCGIQ